MNYGDSESVVDLHTEAKIPPQKPAAGSFLMYT